ncbi:hypothetical protein AB9N12_11730 [Bacteroides sp. AN502(2024)]|uniref:hypothetical protein n=1 Tax=Bacteroides sp. AN502(2024) TaxID=3160599 RepID=UPI003517630A
MKKIILLLTFMCAAVMLPAQENIEHLTFKGIPIDGTLKEFTAKLKQKGFTYISSEEGAAMFSGDFAGYKNCTAVAVSSKERDLVCKVGVVFPSCDKWSELESNYMSLKQMLTKKYGEPSECVEEFQSLFSPQDDNQKIHELRLDRCKYYSEFETERGSIELQLSHQSVMECFVILSYYDGINQKAILSDAMDDL